MAYMMPVPQDLMNRPRIRRMFAPRVSGPLPQTLDAVPQPDPFQRQTSLPGDVTRTPSSLLPGSMGWEGPPMRDVPTPQPPYPGPPTPASNGFSSMYSEDLTSMVRSVRQGAEGGIRMGKRSEDLVPQIEAAQTGIKDVRASHDYDPSAGRKILGIAASILGGPNAYSNITNAPRQKAMMPYLQDIAGLQNLQKQFGETAGIYEHAGTNVPSTLNAIANMDQNNLRAQEFEAGRGEQAKVYNPATGRNEVMTFMLSGRRGPGLVPGSGQPEAVTYGAPQSMMGPDNVPRLGQFPINQPQSTMFPPQVSKYGPAPSNPTEAFTTFAPPAERTLGGFERFEKSRQQPQLTVFNAETQRANATIQAKAAAFSAYTNSPGSNVNLAVRQIQHREDLTPDMKTAAILHIYEIDERRRNGESLAEILLGQRAIPSGPPVRK